MLALRLALALAAGIAAIVLVPGSPAVAAGSAGSRAAVAAAAGGLLLAAQPCYRALLRTELRIEAVRGIASVTGALMLVLVAATIAMGGSVIGVFAAITLATLAGLALAAWLARNSFRFRLGFDSRAWGELIREAWPVGGNLFLVLLVYRIPPLLLMRLHGPVEVGEYTAAARLIEASNLVADGA
jgi:O-antigen/teichoic acid export membrane protein